MSSHQLSCFTWLHSPRKGAKGNVMVRGERGMTGYDNTCRLQTSWVESQFPTSNLIQKSDKSALVAATLAFLA